MRSAVRSFSRVAARGLATAVARHTVVRSAAPRVALATAGVVLGVTYYSFRQAQASEIPFTGVPGTIHERTFVAIKPDGVDRGLIAEVIARYERKGYVLVGMKLLHPSKEQAEGHYADLKGKPFFPGLVEYFSSGPIVAMVWQGKGVIKGSRTLLGATDPAASAPGTIRGDFAIEVGRNIVHSSDAPETAQREIAFWFKPEEIVNWKPSSYKFITEQRF